MTEVEYSQASEASELCQACGLCCTGHLFAWVRLKAAELTPLEKLGLPVIRNDPRQRGFVQPCPMWNGVCTIYASPHYPSGCRSYNCQLLRELLDESVGLDQALRVVKQAKAKIRSVEKLLQPSAYPSFRDRLVEQLERGEESTPEFRARANDLLEFFNQQFGAKDFT
jgi:uncharacterized protein